MSTPEKAEIGMRFKMGPWEWRVIETRRGAFQAKSDSFNSNIVDIDARDANQLDWLPEPVTFTEAQRDAIKKESYCWKTFHPWLDSHTVHEEKEGCQDCSIHDAAIICRCHCHKQ